MKCVLARPVATAATFLLLLLCAPETGYSFNLRDNGHGVSQDHPEKGVQVTPVVKVLNSGTSGSAVVIGESSGTYTIATAHHVVSQSSLSELAVETADNSRLRVIKIVRPLPKIDFALLIAEKTKMLPVAILPFLDEELWAKVDSWPTVYVIGYSAPTPDAPESVFRSDHGEVQSVLSGSEDGYNLLYKAKTVIGMSGGGIFAETHQVIPFIKDPFASKPEYFYHDIVKGDHALSGLFGGDDLQDEIWDLSKHYPFQNAFYARCMSSPQWKPEFSERGRFFSQETWEDLSSGFERSALCRQAASMSYEYKNCGLNGNVAWATGKHKDPNSFLLIAIHGRAERADHDSGSRTGSALGVYLGSPAIKNYLESRKNELGLRPAYSYAAQVCKTS